MHGLPGKCYSQKARASCHAPDGWHSPASIRHRCRWREQCPWPPAMSAAHRQPHRFPPRPRLRRPTLSDTKPGCDHRYGQRQQPVPRSSRHPATKAKGQKEAYVSLQIRVLTSKGKIIPAKRQGNHRLFFAARHFAPTEGTWNRSGRNTLSNGKSQAVRGEKQMSFKFFKVKKME